jgi:uncharacterized protein (DUF3084 family)
VFSIAHLFAIVAATSILQAMNVSLEAALAEDIMIQLKRYFFHRLKSEAIMGLAILILCGVAVVSGATVGIIFLVTAKPRNMQVPSEVADLRNEVAHLREKIERLSEDVEQLRNKPKASGSTDIKG